MQGLLKEFITGRWKQPKYPYITTNVAYTYNGVLFSLKRKEIQTQATTRMDLENTMLGEIS